MQFLSDYIKFVILMLNEHKINGQTGNSEMCEKF